MWYFAVTILVLCQGVAVDALVDASWPLSIVSPEIAKRLVPQDKVYVDVIHNTKHTALGRVIVTISAGEMKTSVFALVAYIATDLLIGIDAMSELNLTFSVGNTNYRVDLPTDRSVRRIVESLDDDQLNIENVQRHLQTHCNSCCFNPKPAIIIVIRKSDTVATNNITPQYDSPPI